MEKLDKNKAYEIYKTLDAMFPNACCELVYHNLYELAIAVILSAQTTDAQVNKVTVGLFNRFPDIDSLANASIEEVIPYIQRLGLYKNKARNIILFAKKAKEEYQGIPNTFEELVTLPGVGRKTANVILAEYFHIPRIAVDTHVLRVANRLGLSESNNPLIVEKDLMNLFPEEIWGELHLKLLFFGRYFCTAKAPQCLNCFYKNQCKK